MSNIKKTLITGLLFCGVMLPMSLSALEEVKPNPQSTENTPKVEQTHWRGGGYWGGGRGYWGGGYGYGYSPYYYSYYPYNYSYSYPYYTYGYTYPYTYSYYPYYYYG